MQITNESQHMTLDWSNSLSPQWSRQAVITISHYDLEDHRNKKWSRHRSFLYGCDRSPETHVSKLGTEIPNLNNTTGLQKWFENSKVREFGYV